MDPYGSLLAEPKELNESTTTFYEVCIIKYMFRIYTHNVSLYKLDYCLFALFVILHFEETICKLFLNLKYHRLLYKENNFNCDFLSYTG